MVKKQHHPVRVILWRTRRLARLAWASRRVADLELALGVGTQWRWGGPLNGQRGRQQIVRWIGQQVDFGAAIETGTWLGASTCFLADVLGCDIWSVEANPDPYRFVARVLAHRVDVHLSLDDSRRFLRELDLEPGDRAVFVYLDSHWDPDDLPLWEEIRIVFKRWPDAVVMIDDFCVPGDPGYSHDDYGPGNSLEVSVLEDHLPEGVTVLFPTLASADETGAHRGCCILTAEHTAERLKGDLLRR